MENTFDVPEGFFPILNWDVHAKRNDPVKDLEEIADCGFTLTGFVRPEEIPACEQLGLKAIVQIGIGRKEWKELSDEEIGARVKKVIEQTPDSDAVFGYYICDEPGAGLFPKLAVAVAAVKEFAPGKLAYINLYPSYATLGAPDDSQLETKTYNEYLDRYIDEVKPQFISYDNYKVQWSLDLKREDAAAVYWRDLLTFRQKGLDRGYDFWNIVSSNQIRPYTTPPSSANLLFQAYTTLAAGGKSVGWYTYYTGGYGYGPVNRDGTRNVSWNYLKMVNDQLKVIGPMMMDLESIGVYFTEPLPKKDVPTLPGGIIESATADSPLMIGEFKNGEGEQYAMIVNAGLEKSTKFSLVPKDETRNICHFSPVDGSALPLEEENSLWLAAGQGVLLKFE